MSNRIKRRRRGRANRKSEPAGEFLMTYVTGPNEEPCDCPICRIMGIDVSTVEGGVDVRPITPEQRAQLEVYLRGEEVPN